MSEYGIKIKNIQAGSIYGMNIGIRPNLDTTPAMLSNSLLTDFLLEKCHMKLWKGESTRDIIGISFDYGTLSYDEEIKKLENKIKSVKDDSSISKKEKERRISNIESYIERANKLKNKFDKKTKEQLREMFYKDGVNVTYNSYTKDGTLKKSETIHYNMAYRSPGKAKKGNCMFICDRIFEKAKKFLQMNIQLPDTNTPIVEIGAYSSLIASSIVDRVQIKPHEILIVKDISSICKKTVTSVELNKKKECIAVKKENYEVENVLFDGQALIDTSIFPEWADGFVVLRHHFFKCAAFHSNLQLFFRDYYGDKYWNATVTDMFGNKRYVKNIKLITTENATKWIKFSNLEIDYKYWCKQISKNGFKFGIVKTGHESKLGDVQQMSYQMVNALKLEDMPEIMYKSVKYVERLKKDDDEFLDFLEHRANFMNDFDAIRSIVKQNPLFIESDYFRNRRKAVIQSYILQMKNGKVIQNAENLTIVGSPYAMLLHAVGELDVNNPIDPTFNTEDEAIQCYTERFNEDEYLACMRSPFNSTANLSAVHNIYHVYLARYFNLGRLVIAVNCIGTDWQCRNNGADQDGDTVYTTNQSNIVEHAKYCYTHIPTVVNNIPQNKKTYTNNLLEYANVDNLLAHSQRAIGESSNIAQICLTYTYNNNDRKFQDYADILAVIAQICIDSTKKAYDIDLSKEISRIKTDIGVDETGYPEFWSVIRPDFPVDKINHDLKCPMNYVYNIPFKRFRRKSEVIDVKDFLVKHELKTDRRKSRKVEDMIERFALEVYKYRINENDSDESVLVLREDFDQMIDTIRAMYISKEYAGLMYWLLYRGLVIGKNHNNVSKLYKNRSILLATLYAVNPQVFLSCFTKESV